MPTFELLVRTKDKINPKDAVLNAKLTKRGDVIHAALAPHDWGKEEIANPEWTIVKVDLTKEQSQSLLAPELPPDLSKEYRMLRKRGLKLDLDTLGITAADAPRSDPKAALDSSAVASAFVVKPRLAEPDQIVFPDSLAFA